MLTNVKSQLESLSDNQIILQLSRCVAMANNGHTTIHLSGMDKIPVRFYWFADGLYIIKTDKSSAQYLGAKVSAINSIKTDTVLRRLKPYLSGIVPAKDLKVDKEIKLCYEDYCDGRDPILEWIINQEQ